MARKWGQEIREQNEKLCNWRQAGSPGIFCLSGEGQTPFQTEPSWTAPLGIECFDICRSSKLTSRFGASHGFRVKTVASAKTANPKWRCPASEFPRASVEAALNMAGVLSEMSR